MNLSLPPSITHTHTRSFGCIFKLLFVFVSWSYFFILSFRYKGGPTLPRKMISQGVFNRKQFNVEVYPLCLKLIDPRDDSESTIRISKKVMSFSFCFSLCFSLLIFKMVLFNTLLFAWNIIFLTYKVLMCLINVHQIMALAGWVFGSLVY